MIFDAVNEGEVILTRNLVPNNHGLTKMHVVWAYPLVYLIISGLVKNSVRKQFWIFQTAITWAVIDGFWSDLKEELGEVSKNFNE